MVDSNTNYYALLGLGQDAKPADVKRSYRAALLRIHPDKQMQPSKEEHATPGLAIARLQDAFHTLSDSKLRADYDRSLLIEGGGRTTQTIVAQRPAHEVSLDGFDLMEEVAIEGGGVELRWRYSCRCGSAFTIEERQLEEGAHYIACGGCSEVIWVGYEAVEDMEGDRDESDPK